jgi:hypothetical protein
MKAQELRTIADAARAKYAEERPIFLRDDLIKRMECLSKQGICCIDFAFSDTQEIIFQAIELLRAEGFKIAKLSRTSHIIRIEW